MIAKIGSNHIDVKCIPGRADRVRTGQEALNRAYHIHTSTFAYSIVCAYVYNAPCITCGINVVRYSTSAYLTFPASLMTQICYN